MFPGHTQAFLASRTRQGTNLKKKKKFFIGTVFNKTLDNAYNGIMAILILSILKTLNKVDITYNALIIRLIKATFHMCFYQLLYKVIYK